LVIGCDSPGGGGGGGLVDCSVTPNLPVCRPDTGSSDASDTTDTTNTGPDTQTGPDTTQTDTITPECSGSARRCSGANAQACSAGSWVTVAFCEGSTTCQNGVCVPTAVCTNGTRRCSGSAVEVCSAGQWTTEQSCTNGCTNNQCNAAPTGLVCMDVWACIIDAGCFDNLPTVPTSACMNPCLNQGTSTGKNEMNAMLSCSSNCSYDDACIIDTCSQQRANCFFDTAGSLSCAAVNTCIGNCPTGGAYEACAFSCYEQATNTAQGRHFRVVNCLNYHCDDDDQTCQREVISSGGPCEQAYNICFP